MQKSSKNERRRTLCLPKDTKPSKAARFRFLKDREARQSLKDDQSSSDEDGDGTESDDQDGSSSSDEGRESHDEPQMKERQKAKEDQVTISKAMSLATEANKASRKSYVALRQLADGFPKTHGA